MKRTFRFADFELDTAAGSLRRGVQTLPVTPKIYALLLALVERPGELVTKEELMARLWPDTAVEEANLSVTMSALRKILGEQPPDVKFIETVPRRGYRFVGPLASEDPAPRPPGPDAPAPPVPRTRRRWWIPAAAAVLLLAGAGSLWLLLRPAPGYRTLAVLPFRTASADPATASLGLGMADSLIFRLAAAQTIMVRPTSSVLRFADQDPIAAGRALSADIVLTGFLQFDGRNLRVTTQLLRVSDGASVWNGKFENSFTNIFMVQDTIAGRVADSLAMQLSDPARARMNRRPTESTEAYKEYVLGRFLLTSARPDETQRAARHLERAIQIDPSYALAYGALSEAYVDSLRTQPTSEGREMARQYALKALEIDPQLARAHSAIGGVQLWGDWNWTAARASCDKAKTLDNLDAVVRQFCGATLLSLGEFDAASEEFRAATEVDPEWRDPLAFRALAELAAGRLDRAEALTLALRARFPQDQFVTRNLAKVRWRQKRLPEAVALQREAVRQYPAPIPRGELAHMLAATGKSGEALGLVASIDQEPAAEPAAFARALAYAGLGDKDRAFKELDLAIQARTMALVWIRFNPLLDSLRRDPRFAAAVRRVGS